MRFRLLESVFGEIVKRQVFHYIYKNPTGAELNAKDESKDNRAVLDAEGNMYMEAAWDKEGNRGEDGIFSELIHNDLIFELHKKGVVQELKISAWNIDAEALYYGVCVQRNGDTKQFYIAESYDEFMIGFKGEFEEMFKIAKEKNPYCEFIPDFIFHA